MHAAILVHRVSNPQQIAAGAKVSEREEKSAIAERGGQRVGWQSAVRAGCEANSALESA